MARFITVSKATKDPVLLWEEDGMRVVSRHASVEDVPEADGLEVHAFDVDTSDTVPGWLDRSRVNQGNAPVYDADGRPLWAGARVAFRLQLHSINTFEDEGEFRDVNEYGGSRLISDAAHNVYDRRGFIVRKDRERYVAMNEYRRHGDLKGALLLRGGVGDPYEHGRTETFVRLTDDPRRVCTLDHVVGAAPKGP